MKNRLDEHLYKTIKTQYNTNGYWFCHDPKYILLKDYIEDFKMLFSTLIVFQLIQVMFLMENPGATKIYEKQLHTIVKTLYEKFVNRDETILKYSKKKKKYFIVFQKRSIIHTEIFYKLLIIVLYSENSQHHKCFWCVANDSVQYLTHKKHNFRHWKRYHIMWI